MKLSIEGKVPSGYIRGQIAQIFREIQTAFNTLAEERIAAHYGAGTAAPTTGDWKQGDFVRNSTPTELGSAASMYVILGWVNVASGSPGTWKQCRVLTGN